MVKRRSSHSETARTTLSVVIVYEDGAARERAHEFCHHLEKQHATQEDVFVHWCSFEEIKQPDDAVRAFVEVMDADFIVLASGPDGELPHAVKFWLESCLRKRQSREGSVVGLIPADRGVGATASSKEIYLRQVAHRAGMDYLSKNPPPAATKSMPDSLDSYRERAGQMTSVLDTILHTRPLPPRS